MPITAQTAIDIARAHREIEAATALLDEVKLAQSDSRPVDVRDHFGRVRGCQLGVPSGDNGHRILDLSWELAVPIIEAHIAQKQAALVAFSEKARTEI